MRKITTWAADVKGKREKISAGRPQAGQAYLSSLLRAEIMGRLFGWGQRVATLR